MRTDILSHAKGDVYFITVNLVERKNNRPLVEKTNELREAFKYERSKSPFE